VAAGAALGAATLVSPAPGTIVDAARPTFSWSLPANEQSDAVFVARRPTTTADGAFVDANLAASGSVLPAQTRWRPSERLGAGAYWWLVRSLDKTTSRPVYTRPARFTIPVGLRVFPLRVAPSSGTHRVTVTVRWRTNAPRVRVDAAAYLRGRRVWWGRSTYKFPPVNEAQATRYTWTPPHGVDAGAKLTLKARVTAGRLRFTRSRTFSAP
jgi:hypothetical protein